MQKVIRSIIVLLFIFVLLVFYNSLNKETNYSTDYLVGNKLTKINLKSFNDNKIYTMEIPTEELITSFNNTFMNTALNELHKYLKNQINYEKGKSKK